ncbi:hypothetical protein DL96DRAFT_1827045 [Flagelloscypha sp. PMI_526]|nr:hypothetical protein DL96DRAFT_1827045 [Flagelloscypha sp. PMI_526]
MPSAWALLYKTITRLLFDSIHPNSEMSEDTNGLTVLSIDGASMHQSGVIPPLLILQEIASRFEVDKGSPLDSFRASETFQMIGGVGDGGLLAVMLGYFGISVNEAIQEYLYVLKAVYQNPDAAGWSKDERSQRLEAALKGLVTSKTSPSDENHPLNKPKEDSSGCKIFVTAMHALNLQQPILLRTYRSRNDADQPKCTLVEAIRATTAMPDLFMPVTLGPPHRQIEYFSPACHGFNNPIDQVREEAKETFPGHTISCIISLGCGHPGPVQIKDIKEDAARAVVQLAMDSVRAAEQTYRRLAGIPNLYFRFDVPYGLERAVLKLNPTLSEIRAHITAYVGQEQTSDRINFAVTFILPRRNSDLTLDGILPVETTATVWVKKCPLPSPNFTGRRDELDHMHAYFSSSVGSSTLIYVIYGLGGSGKSQLLFQFVLEFQTRSPRTFDIVYFVDASLETTVEADLKAIAIDRKAGETAVDAVQWLSCQTTRWLLVFDNADDKNFSIQKYIPKSIHGSVIITSRNPELTGLTSKDSGSRRIEDLEKWAADELLKKLVGRRRSSDSEDSLVTQVVEMLHCFALAVTQAGSYMSATGRGYQEYIELFEVERTRLLGERKGLVPDNYPWSVYTTWAISFDQLKTASRHFMQICSYLHYTGIPKDLFKRAAESPPLTEVEERAQIWLSEFMDHTRNNEGRWNPVAFDEIIQNVMSFSLVDYDLETRLFSFHPLVHDWTRETIQFTQSQNFPDVQCALQLVTLSSPDINDRSPASIFLKRRLLPHLDSLVLGAVHISSVPMAVRFSAIYEQTGRWNDFANIFKHAKEVCIPGGEWSVEICNINLAIAYNHLGRHADALDLQLPVLGNLKQTRGDQHPHTLTSMNILASSYQALGRHAEALNLQLLVVAHQKQTLGVDHLDTVLSMSNLASTYQALGKHAEALDLQLSVVAILKRTLGDEHPHVLRSMNNLSLTYQTLGRLTEALDLCHSVIANQKQTLGDDHPDTLLSMSNLALIYHALGRYVEAVDLQLSVLSNRKRILGDEHPDTLLSMNNLAGSYQSLARHAEALDLYLSVVSDRKRVLGDAHPHTLSSMNSLASTYQALGRYAEALDLHLFVHANQKQTLGDQHPDTLRGMNNLAETYRALGRHAEALELQLSVVATWKRTLGDQHPDMLISMNNLAIIYKALGRYAVALDLQLSVLANQKTILGDQHPDTLTTINNLAATYMDLERHSEATELLTPAVNIAIHTLGVEHPIALTLQERLELCLSLDSGVVDGDSFGEVLDSIAATISKYERERRWEDVIEQQEIAVEVFSAMLGECHPKTVQTLYRLAFNLIRLDLTDNARPRIERAYQLVHDDSFPSESHLQPQVLKIKQLYTQHCLDRSSNAQVSLTEARANIVPSKPGRGQVSMPLVAYERSGQTRAADAAETRRNASNDQSKDRNKGTDGTGTTGSTGTAEAENSQNVSAAILSTSQAASARISQTVSEAPKTSRENARKGKAREFTSTLNAGAESTSPAVTRPSVDGPSTSQDNSRIISFTPKTGRDVMGNRVHLHKTVQTSFQEHETSVLESGKSNGEGSRSRINDSVKAYVDAAASAIRADLAREARAIRREVRIQHKETRRQSEKALTTFVRQIFGNDNAKDLIDELRHLVTAVQDADDELEGPSRQTSRGRSRSRNFSPASLGHRGFSLSHASSYSPPRRRRSHSLSSSDLSTSRSRSHSPSYGHRLRSRSPSDILDSPSPSLIAGPSSTSNQPQSGKRAREDDDLSRPFKKARFTDDDAGSGLTDDSKDVYLAHFNWSTTSRKANQASVQKMWESAGGSRLPSIHFIEALQYSGRVSVLRLGFTSSKRAKSFAGSWNLKILPLQKVHAYLDMGDIPARG